MQERGLKKGAGGKDTHIKVLELFADIGSHLVDMQCIRLESKEVAVERSAEHSVRGAKSKVVGNSAAIEDVLQLARARVERKRLHPEADVWDLFSIGQNKGQRGGNKLRRTQAS